MQRKDDLNNNIENETKNGINKEDINNDKSKSNDSEDEESEKEEENEDKKDSESKSDSSEEKNDNNIKSNDNEEEEESEDEAEKTEEEDENSENIDKKLESSKEKENKDNNLNVNNILKSFKKYEEDKLPFIPLNIYNEKNNKYLEEYKNNTINNDQLNTNEESKNLKIIKEIEQDLIELSENIENIFLKLDTSLIHDEKYLIDSLVIEAKKEGLLDETFGNKEDNKEIKDDLIIGYNENKNIKKEKIKSERINMSKIYEINNKEIINNKDKKKFPYDYNKNKAYYEALNKKLDFNKNYLINSIQTQSDIFKSQEKDYFINNNQINSNSRNNIINKRELNNFSNFSFKINNNMTNNLLSSTDTNGPFRYTRRDRNEPDLMQLLMDK